MIAFHSLLHLNWKQNANLAELQSLEYYFGSVNDLPRFAFLEITRLICRPHIYRCLTSKLMMDFNAVKTEYFPSHQNYFSYRFPKALYKITHTDYFLIAE